MIATVVIGEQENTSAYVDEELSKYSLNKTHPDFLLILDKAGVEDVKKIREFLSIKPTVLKFKGVFIQNGELLTPDAQNALLKTLEEPPNFALIFLGTKNETNLLPTVLSRCKIISLNQTALSDDLVKFDEILGLIEGFSIEKRFEIVEKTDQKDLFLKALVKKYRSKLLNGSNPDFLKLLIKAEQWQKQNVNIRAILEYLMLELPSKQ